MALFDGLFSKLRGVKNQDNAAMQAMFQFKLYEGQPNLMPDDPVQYLEKGYSGNTTVYSIISYIESMSKQARLTLKDKEGKVIEDHELTKFLSKVNNRMTLSEFLSAFLIYRLTVGEAFVYKLALTAGLNKGKVHELHMLPSANVEIIEGTWMDPVRGYKVEGNYNVEMGVDEVYHSKLFNPNFDRERSLHGLSPLRAAANTVTKLNQIEITEAKVFENQGPKYILFRKNKEIMQRMDDTQVKDATRLLKQAGKAENRGLPLIMKDEYEKLELGQKLADMEIVGSSEAGVIALCGVYRFPGQILGYGQTTYNNMNTAVKAAWTNCIMPNLNEFANLMNECLVNNIPEYKGLRFEYDYSEVEELQDGMVEKVTWMTKARWTGNEIRQATGKTPNENPLMDDPIIPMGEGFLSDASEPLDGEKDFSDYLKT